MIEETYNGETTEVVQLNEKQAGFDLTRFEEGAFEQIQEDFNLGEFQQTETEFSTFYVTESDLVKVIVKRKPNDEREGHEDEIGYVGYIGIEGRRDVVNKLFERIEDDATYIKGEDYGGAQGKYPNERAFI